MKKINKITIFTSNQPRHLHLIRLLSEIAETVYVIQECNTVFPGQTQDFFNKSDTMKEYFGHVMKAEADVFWEGLGFVPKNVKTLSIKMGDLNGFNNTFFREALFSDYFITFGCSYIKGKLADFLVRNRCINIHMGISPYYRGSSTNFWPMLAGDYHLVGATIHELSHGLDSGDILFHVLPPCQAHGPWLHDPWLMGMKCVKWAHEAVRDMLQRNELRFMEAVKQDKTQQIKYTRNRDFTDEIARQYLDNLPTQEAIKRDLESRDKGLYINPVIGGKEASYERA